MNKERLKSQNNVLEMIGRTPLVRLNRIPQEFGIKCQIYAKIEGQNPGASTKDRIAVAMIQKAEQEGKLQGVDTIVEASSGNTGMGVALVCAIKGYKAIITIQDRMSSEKINRLKALGAKVIVCPSDLPKGHPQHYLSIAKKLSTQDNVFYTDQYNNNANSEVHFEQTAQEIFEQTEQKLDYFICGVGSGGTITGCAQFFRKNSPSTKVIGVDPDGSLLALPAELNKCSEMIRVEGIGKNKPPGVLDRSIIDGWVKVSDKESFQMAQQIIKKEGIFCGGSCGSALKGAIKYLKQIGVDQNPDIKVVIVFADSTTNYLTRFMKQEWMVACGYQNWNTLVNKKSLLYGKKLSDYDFIKQVPIINQNEQQSVEQIVKLFQQGYDAMPIVKDNKITSVFDKQIFQKKILKQNLNLNDDAYKGKSIDVYQLPYDTDFSVVQQLLEDYQCLLMVKKNQNRIESVHCVNLSDMLRCYQQEKQKLSDNNKVQRNKKILKLTKKSKIQNLQA